VRAGLGRTAQQAVTPKADDDMPSACTADTGSRAPVFPALAQSLPARRGVRRGARWGLQGLAALCLTAAFGAAPAAAQSLEEALVEAYINNPSLLSQRASVRTTDEGVPQALANWRPTVQITGDYGYELNKSNQRATTNASRRLEPASVGIDLTQPLFRGGRTLAEVSQAENAVQAARARLLDTEQSILLEAATAYLNVVRDQATLLLNINNERVLRRQLEATQDRFQVGEITRTDVHQAEARLARSTATRIQGEGALENSRAAYQNVVGSFPQSELAFPPQPSDLPDSKDEAIRRAAISNPNVIAAQFDHEAALDNVDSQWGQLLPELEITASMDRSLEASAVGQEVDSVSAQVSLTMPLYQQGAVYSQVREAKQQVAEELRTIDQQRRDAVELATTAWENLLSARARVEAFQTQVQAAEIAFDGVEREASVGSRTVLDVLDAEQELLDARVSAVTAQRDELVAAFQLKSAVGELTAFHLELPVQLYDPQEHYNDVRDRWFGTSGPGNGVDGQPRGGEGDEASE
jgi:outer membrane protein